MCLYYGFWVGVVVFVVVGIVVDVVVYFGYGVWWDCWCGFFFGFGGVGFCVDLFCVVVCWIVDGGDLFVDEGLFFECKDVVLVLKFGFSLDY